MLLSIGYCINAYHSISCHLLLENVVLVNSLRSLNLHAREVLLFVFLMVSLFIEAWPVELTYGDNQVLVMGTWVFMLTTCMALLLGAISMFEEDIPEPGRRNK